MSDGTEKFPTLAISSASASPSSMTPTGEEQHREEAQVHDLVAPEESSEKTRNQDLLALPKRDFLAGLRKLIRSFKGLSHIFELYRQEGEQEQDQAMGVGKGVDTGMEIGLPTDVQHVAHIGLDGSSDIASTLRSLGGAQELLSLSNLSLEQFELAMAKLVRCERSVVAPN